MAARPRAGAARAGLTSRGGRPEPRPRGGRARELARKPLSRFPDPRQAPADLPLARGGDLEPATLLDAYRQGIFPWPTGERRLWWWSPDPRMVFPLEAGPPEHPGIHVSRSLARTLRRGTFTTTRDQAFNAIIRGCAQRPGEGTWITRAMIAAYTRLHELGLAHSVEVWDEERTLAGGVYGVTIGGAFMGESMFSRQRDASKVALVALARHLRERGFTLFDAQLPTPHLASLGAIELRREVFLDRLAEAVAAPVVW